MNKTIWALAFVVLCSGMAFAIQNASTVVEGTQSSWSNDLGAANYTTEGGNVTPLNLDVNTSTDKWAGAYGNVTGNLVLAEAGQTQFMYTWTYNTSSGGEVCASTNSNPIWSQLGATTAVLLNTIWVFGADADNATNTYNETDNFDIEAFSGPTASTHVQGSSTFRVGVLEISAGVPAAENDLAFCVNISDVGTNYLGNAANFEMIVPTTEAVLPGGTETYFFYIELV